MVLKWDRLSCFLERRSESWRARVIRMTGDFEDTGRRSSGVVSEVHWMIGGELWDCR